MTAASHKGDANRMLNKLIMSAGAPSLAIGIDSASFAFGCRIAGGGVPTGGGGVEIGLLLSIAVGVWGIFALLLRGKPGRE